MQALYLIISFLSAAWCFKYEIGVLHDTTFNVRKWNMEFTLRYISGQISRLLKYYNQASVIIDPMSVQFDLKDVSSHKNWKGLINKYGLIFTLTDCSTALVISELARLALVPHIHLSFLQCAAPGLTKLDDWAVHAFTIFSNLGDGFEDEIRSMIMEAERDTYAVLLFEELEGSFDDVPIPDPTSHVRLHSVGFQYLNATSQFDPARRRLKPHPLENILEAWRFNPPKYVFFRPRTIDIDLALNMALKKEIISQASYWIVMGETDASLDRISLALTTQESTHPKVHRHRLRKARRPNVAILRRVPIVELYECNQDAYNSVLTERLIDLFQCDISKYPERVILLGVLALQASISRNDLLFKQHTKQLNIHEQIIENVTKWITLSGMRNNVWLLSTKTHKNIGIEMVSTANLRFQDRVYLTEQGRELAEKSYSSGLFANTFYSFFDLTLRIGFVEYMNFVETNSAENYSLGYVQQGNARGYAVDILNELAGAFEFNYILIPAKDGQFGFELPNGTWTGMVKQIIDNDVDMAIGPITITGSRAKVVDFLATFLSVRLACFVRSDKEDSLARFANPLQRDTWFLIIGSIFITAGCICLLNRLSPFSAWNRGFPDSISDEVSLVENTWSLFGGFVQQGHDFYPYAHSSRFLLVVWWIFVVLVQATYQSQLVAFLSQQKVFLPVASLSELAENKRITPIVINNSLAAETVKAAHPETPLSRISKRVRAVGFVEAIQMMMHSKDFALIHEDRPIRGAIGDEWSKFGVIKGQYSSFKYGFPVAKDVEFAEAFSLYIRRLRESGIILQLSKKWLPDFQHSKKGIVKGIAVQLEHCSGAFLILSTSLLSAGLILLCECLYAKCRQRAWSYRTRF